MEEQLNNLKAFPYDSSKRVDLENGRKAWEEVTGKAADPSSYIPQGQDIVAHTWCWLQSNW